MKNHLLRFAAILVAAVCMTSWAAQAGEGDSASKVKVALVPGKIDDSGKQTVAIHIQVDRDWHIYANPVDNKEFENNATLVRLAKDSTGRLIKVDYPPGQKHVEKNGQEFQVYKGKTTIQALVQRGGNTQPLALTLQVYACNDNICLPKGIVPLLVK